MSDTLTEIEGLRVEIINMIKGLEEYPDLLDANGDVRAAMEIIVQRLDMIINNSKVDDELIVKCGDKIIKIDKFFGKGTNE